MSACMYVCAPCVCLMPKERGTGVGSPGARVMGGCELPHGCWGLNPDPLQEQLVFLPLSSLPTG